MIFIRFNLGNFPTQIYETCKNILEKNCFNRQDRLKNRLIGNFRSIIANYRILFGLSAVHD